MFEKELPARPSLEQYKKQAKDLVRHCAFGDAASLLRMERNHPRFHQLTEAELLAAPVSLTDAQLVLAREHGFESWPKFARHIETDTLIRAVADLRDPVAAFIEVACVPRYTGHATGTLDHAEMILSRYPQVRGSSVYTAAILADEAAVHGFLARDTRSATAKGGPYDWDALTYLCFSRYLRLDKARSEAFVRTARVLLDAGSSANTGWIELIDQPTPRPILESAIYGAAAVARHSELTHLLLQRGADPNDDETPYHLPEGYDNQVMKLVLESGKLTPASLSWMLLRKADWHDLEGLRMVLEHGGDPKLVPVFGGNALDWALRRDNRLEAIALLLDYGADPAIQNAREGQTAAAVAAHRGRGDALRLFEQRGIPLKLQGVDQLIAACAKGDREGIALLVASEPSLVQELVPIGGNLLGRFAGVANVEGIRCLLDLGVSVDALFAHGDPYFDIAWGSTALHVAAWKACAWESTGETVKELLARGAPVNAPDGKGRTALALAVKACVDSHWSDRRTPEPVRVLLAAGAKVGDIKLPCGYDEVDALLSS